MTRFTAALQCCFAEQVREYTHLFDRSTLSILQIIIRFSKRTMQYVCELGAALSVYVHVLHPTAVEYCILLPSRSATCALLSHPRHRDPLSAGGIYAASTAAECHRNMQPVLHGICACSINNAARPCALQNN